MQLLRFHYRKLFACLGCAGVLLILTLHILAEKGDEENIVANSLIHHRELAKDKKSKTVIESAKPIEAAPPPSAGEKTETQGSKFDIPILGRRTPQLTYGNFDPFGDLFQQITQVS